MKVTLNKNILGLSDDLCWICGRKFDNIIILTRHHAIPRRMKPKINITVPVCKECHNKENLIAGDLKMKADRLKGYLSSIIKKIGKITE
jgi:5-methylcytosine-specific restriction endonuclease McrA